jgi:hypothetical protein
MLFESFEPIQTELKPSDETLQQGRNLDHGKLDSHILINIMFMLVIFSDFHFIHD